MPIIRFPAGMKPNVDLIEAAIRACGLCDPCDSGGGFDCCASSDLGTNGPVPCTVTLKIEGFPFAGFDGSAIPTSWAEIDATTGHGQRFANTTYTMKCLEPDNPAGCGDWYLEGETPFDFTDHNELGVYESEYAYTLPVEGGDDLHVRWVARLHAKFICPSPKLYEDGDLARPHSIALEIGTYFIKYTDIDPTGTVFGAPLIYRPYQNDWDIATQTVTFTPTSPNVNSLSLSNLPSLIDADDANRYVHTLLDDFAAPAAKVTVYW